MAEPERLKGRPPAAGVCVDEADGDTDDALPGRTYDSSCPSRGVGSAEDEDDEESLYLPIQLRLRGASGLDARRSDIVQECVDVRREERATEAYKRWKQEEEASGGRSAHLSVDLTT